MFINKEIISVFLQYFFMIIFYNIKPPGKNLIITVVINYAYSRVICAL